MRTILKAAMLGTALSVTALCGGTAFADDAAAPAPAVSFTGNISIATDYMFRGISQTNSEPAVSGGFDASAGQFYAGTWASSISFAPMEWDLYAGFKPVTGPISWDIGAIGYLYPSAPDKGLPEDDYWEGYIKPSMALGPATVGVSFYASPDFTLETGTAYYIEGNAALPITKALSVSGAVGYQSIDDINGPLAGSPEAHYVTWNAGATYSIAGFALDLRYVDTDIGNLDPIVTSGFTSVHNSKSRVMFSIKRAM